MVQGLRTDQETPVSEYLDREIDLALRIARKEPTTADERKHAEKSIVAKRIAGEVADIVANSADVDVDIATMKGNMLKAMKEGVEPKGFGEAFSDEMKKGPDFDIMHPFDSLKNMAGTLMGAFKEGIKQMLLGSAGEWLAPILKSVKSHVVAFFSSKAKPMGTDEAEHDLAMQNAAAGLGKYFGVTREEENKFGNEAALEIKTAMDPDTTAKRLSTGEGVKERSRTHELTAGEVRKVAEAIRTSDVAVLKQVDGNVDHNIDGKYDKAEMLKFAATVLGTDKTNPNQVLTVPDEILADLTVQLTTKVNKPAEPGQSK